MNLSVSHIKNNIKVDSFEMKINRSTSKYKNKYMLLNKKIKNNNTSLNKKLYCNKLYVLIFKLKNKIKKKEAFLKRHKTF